MNQEQLLAELQQVVEYCRANKPKVKYSRDRSSFPPEEDVSTTYEEQYPKAQYPIEEKEPEVEAPKKPSLLESCIQEIKIRIQEKLEHQFRKKPPYLKFLFDMLNKRNMTNAEFYKKAHIDRRHFSKICNNYDYIPSRNTIFLMCLALELSTSEAYKFLNLFGYGFCEYEETDVIVFYLLEKKIYDIDLCNELLMKFDENPLEKLP